MTDSETIKTLAWVGLMIFVTQAVSFYAIVKLFTSGKAAVFERRDKPMSWREQA